MEVQAEKTAHPFTQNTYRVSLTAAEKELSELEDRLETVGEEIEELTQRKAQLESELASGHERQTRLKATVDALRTLCEADHNAKWAEKAALFGKGPKGIQECCYQVLAEADHAMTAPMIAEQLGKNGVELTQYKNYLAVIHTSLGRMAPERVRIFKARFKNKPSGKPRIWYEVVR